MNNTSIFRNTGICVSLSAIDASLSTFKSAAQELSGRTSRLTPSEVTQTYKGAGLVSSLDDFAEYAKGFLDDDALKYAKEVLGNDADDTAKLKKVAQLVEDGSKKIGKKLSKEEFKAGLDALWGDGGVGDALNGDYSEKERAEQFGKAAVMMILSVVGQILCCFIVRSFCQVRHCRL